MRHTVTTLILLLAGAGVAAPALADPDFAAPGWTRSDVRRYYPPERRYVEHHDRGPQGWFELRGGFYDAVNVSATDWTIGFKATGRVAPNVLAGFTTDLHRREDASRTITSSYVDATGHVVTTTSTAFQAESNLWPLMGTLEFHLPAGGFDPYFGGGAGWEFLNVQTNDYVNGYIYDANYDGFGYQFFGGIGLPINGRTKFTAEGYWNGSTVKREVYDPFTGFLVEERVDVDGGGGRAGLAFAF